MTQDYNFEQARKFLEQGKALFEREKYLEAIAQLEQAQELVDFQSALGGEVQIWRANTYDVIGKTAVAIAICQKLAHHPDSQIVKQATYLVTIFSAIDLSQLEDVTSTFPNLDKVPTSNLSQSFSSTNQFAENSNGENQQAIAPVAPTSNSLLFWLIFWLSIITFVCCLGFWLYRFTEIL
jgi:tetratricopeptide (TPR) repeat protein